MTENASNIDLRNFIEEFGMAVESPHIPRMAGRILAYLLVCDPPLQCGNNLREAVGASKGSVSEMLRLLLRRGLIEKIRVTGERRMHYRIKPHAWALALKLQLDRMAQLGEVIERGLQACESNSQAGRTRLEELRDFCAYLDDEIRDFLSRFDSD